MTRGRALGQHSRMGKTMDRCCTASGKPIPGHAKHSFGMRHRKLGQKWSKRLRWEGEGAEGRHSYCTVGRNKLSGRQSQPARANEELRHRKRHPICCSNVKNTQRFKFQPRLLHTAGRCLFWLWRKLQVQLRPVLICGGDGA